MVRFECSEVDPRDQPVGCEGCHQNFHPDAVDFHPDPKGWLCPECDTFNDL